MDIDSIVDGILKMSPPVLLAVVLSFIGKALKNSKLQDFWIPWVLAGLGAVIYPQIAEITKEPIYNVRNPYMFKTLIGVCIGALAVWGHQAFKQVAEFLERKKEGKLPEGETTLIKKPPEEPTSSSAKTIIEAIQKDKPEDK